MNDRISLVLRTKNISPSVLADELGVQRSGISHILNGRNKPSLDFIQKLIKLYPDISIQWILFGEGPMMNPYPGEKPAISQTVPGNAPPERNKPSMPDLFNMQDMVPELPRNSQEGKPEINMDLEIENQNDAFQNVELELQHRKVEPAGIALDSDPDGDNTEVLPVGQAKRKERPVVLPDKETGFPKTEKPVRKITKIVVFYSDRTFVEYNPGNEED